ncbi:MAG TPA: hypothetical protein VL048_14890 [Xanthobacteraceae bacterium]|nr:hypothetical protein [Xanthobacteraceae bacterium]
MKTILTTVAFTTLMLSIAMSAQAQTSSPVQEGDYYDPGKTVVRQPTSRELNEVKHGDYYAPSTAVVPQPTPQELNEVRRGDYYVPTKGN